MAAAFILHVGDDLSHRVVVMERAGLSVIRSACSVQAVENAFAKSEPFAAITFNNDIEAPAFNVIEASRTLSAAPLILFKNPAVDCGDRGFDLVIASHVLPFVWLKSLGKTIEAARKLRDDCADLRANSRRLRAESALLRENPIDYAALWSGNPPDKKDANLDSLRDLGAIAHVLHFLVFERPQHLILSYCLAEPGSPPLFTYRGPKTAVVRSRQELKSRLQAVGLPEEIADFGRQSDATYRVTPSQLHRLGFTRNPR